MKAIVFAAVIFLLAKEGAAQSTGYSAAAALREKSLEGALVGLANSDTALRHSRALSERTHMAGTERQAIRRKDRSLTAAELNDLALRFVQSTRELESARSLLSGS